MYFSDFDCRNDNNSDLGRNVFSDSEDNSAENDTSKDNISHLFGNNDCNTNKKDKLEVIYIRIKMQKNVYYSSPTSYSWFAYYKST